MFYTLRKLISMAVNSRLRFERKAGGKVIAGRDVEGLKQVKFAGKNGVGRGTVFCGEVKIGVASTLGSNCHVNGPVSIGNYCQLGQAVGIYGRDHPLTHITTYVNRNLLDGVMSTFSDVKKVRIGHDVYVGHGAIILKGVTIGNGAVIGAGSVVTNSIPDYAIAYGTPARVAGSRLPENIVRLLQKIEWWNWDEKKVKDHRELFLLDLADPEQLVRFESLLKKFGLI